MWLRCCNLVAISLIFFSGALQANELSVNYGVDGHIRGFTKEKNVSTRQDKDQGFAQLLRVKVEFHHQEGIAVKTRTILSGDKWDGDTPGTNTSVTGSSDNGGGGNDVRLDYGLIEYKKNDWTFSAGRQVANWAHCLTTCDDRRDRALVLTNFGGVYTALIYDKRVEGTIDRDTDDGDMYAVLFLKYGANYEAGFLTAYWNNNDGTYVLGGAWNISPYVRFTLGDYKFNVLANYIGWGDKTSWFSGQHHVYAVSVERMLGSSFKVEAQALEVINGGYLSTGYDTYLSMVNSNPDHNQSQIQAARIGGFGTFTGGKSQDESLYTARVSYLMNSDWTFSLAGGAFSLYQSSTRTETDLWALDGVVTHQLTKHATIKGSYGRIFGDYHLNAGSITLAVAF